MFLQDMQIVLCRVTVHGKAPLGILAITAVVFV